MLIAARVYEQGRGVEGAQHVEENQEPLTWVANPKILAALDKAFYLSFKVFSFKFFFLLFWLLIILETVLAT